MLRARLCLPLMVSSLIFKGSRLWREEMCAKCGMRSRAHP